MHESARVTVPPTNILLVDDQPEDLVALEAALSNVGANLVRARSGAEALRQLLAHDFAVILLDIQMPAMDGYETAGLIRQRERSRNTPIIFMTAQDRGNEQQLRGYAVGAVDYIFKPVDLTVLRSKVLVFVELARTTELARKQAELLRQSEQAALELASERARLLEELEHKNKELEAFSYSVAHDLRAPLRAIDGFSKLLVEDHGERLDAEARQHLDRVRAAARRMAELIDDLLGLARVTRAGLKLESVELGKLARSIADDLERSRPERRTDWQIREDIVVHADQRLMRVLLENLLGNAWKFTVHRDRARIELGVEQTGDAPVYFVRDNGAGFDMAYAHKLFNPFQRLHRATDFEGTGIGLATVERIVRRHGGRVWAEAEVDRGAKFSFTLGRTREPSESIRV